MLMSSLSANRVKTTVFGLILGGVVAAGSTASAQFSGRLIVDPNTLPDLGVRVMAPSAVPAYDAAYLTVKVDSLGPNGYYSLTGANTVRADIDFTRLQPFYVWADSGLSCNQGVNRGHAWNTVTCTGSLPFGATATIQIWFLPMSQEFYCGTPTYVDAAVAPPANGDRNISNNRSIARVDMINCIN